MLKKLLAGFLAITVTLSSMTMPQSVSAETTNTHAVSQSAEGVTSNNEMTVEGTNSFGNLLTDMLSEEMDEQQQNDGCNIFSAEVYDTEVVVDFESTQDATLVAAIYEEDGIKLLASGSLEVYQGEKQAVVSIETESMPQYFYLRCFLIDSETLKPLCTSYESPNYTQEMQEFLAKTTEDFDEEKVLNFDDDTTNNFAVYSDTTQIIPQNEGVNEVVSANGASNTYTIEHADEEITSLQQGDIFAYEYEGGNVLIVKVDSISLDTTDPTNTIATITGMETSMEEVFDYVKIDESAGLDKAEIDASDLEEGVIYNGLVEREDDGVQTYAIIDAEASKKMAISYEFIEKQIGSDALNVTFSGDVEFCVEAGVKLYLALEYQYLEISMEYALGFNAAITGAAKGELPLPTIKISPVPGVDLKMKPSILLDISVGVAINGCLTGTVGFSVSNEDGIKNLTTTPELEMEIKVEGSIFIGVSLKPSLKIISKKLAHAEVEGEVGAEAVGEMMLYEPASTTEKHECSKCIAGEIYGKAAVDFEAQLFNKENLKFELEKSIKAKISDFYYSIDKKKFGFSTCPHRSYKVTVTVKDENGKAVSGALVDGEYTTNDKGKVSFYLPNGKHTVKVKKDGYKDGKKKATIKNAAKSVTVKVEKEKIKIKQLSLGYHSSGALMSDGSLYMWGNAYYGQSGVEKKETKCTPTKVLDNVVKASVAGMTNGAIKTGGVLYMWGQNIFGELGDGTREDKYEPVKIMDDVVEVICLGSCYSGAITTDGSLYMWGLNQYGALGDGTTENRYEPVKVLDDVVEVSLGGGHSGAITTDGSLYMWGRNDYGQLGDGTTENRYDPIKVLDDVAEVSLYPVHSGAITTDGSLYMWGNNTYGQLGDGTKVDKYEPTKILSDVTEVSLGKYHSGVLKEDGNLYMWGQNCCGELGDGTTTNSSVPIKITIPSTTNSAEVSTVDNYLETINASMKNVNTVDVDNSALTEPKITEDADNPSLKTASFTDLSADEVYNFYVMKSNEEEGVLSSDNLFYIHQVTADSDGNLSITYEMKEEYDEPVIFLVGSSRKNISVAEVSVSDLLYNKTEQFVSPTVIYNGVTLVEGVDYELTGDYSATDVGEYTVIVEGIGDYIGNVAARYSIYCEHEYDDGKITQEISCSQNGIFTYTCGICGGKKTEEIPVKEHEYDEGEITKEATCTENGVLTYSCVNCSHTKTEEVPLKGHTYDAGRATKKASFGQNGQFTKTCVSCGHAITSVINGVKSVELSEITYTYNGKAKTPAVIIKDTTGNPLKSSDYTVTYATDRKNVGMHTVIISLKGNYSGRVEKTFTINPKSVSLSKLKAQKKAITVKWKKQTRQTTGYEIAYSTSKKFTKKTTKNVTVKSNKKTSRVLSKLKAKKKYYVKIRTYKTVKVNGKKTKIYGKWSKVKSIKTK